MASTKDYIYFEIKIWKFVFSVRKRYPTKKAYMKTYMRKHAKDRKAYARYRYANNINGTRDKALQRAKANS